MTTSRLGRVISIALVIFFFCFKRSVGSNAIYQVGKNLSSKLKNYNDSFLSLKLCLHFSFTSHTLMKKCLCLWIATDQSPLLIHRAMFWLPLDFQLPKDWLRLEIFFRFWHAVSDFVHWFLNPTRVSGNVGYWTKKNLTTRFMTDTQKQNKELHHNFCRQLESMLRLPCRVTICPTGTEYLWLSNQGLKHPLA